MILQFYNFTLFALHYKYRSRKVQFSCTWCIFTIVYMVNRMKIARKAKVTNRQTTNIHKYKYMNIYTHSFNWKWHSNCEHLKIICIVMSATKKKSGMKILYRDFINSRYELYRYVNSKESNGIYTTHANKHLYKHTWCE